MVHEDYAVPTPLHRPDHLGDTQYAGSVGSRKGLVQQHDERFLRQGAANFEETLFTKGQIPCHPLEAVDAQFVGDGSDDTQVFGISSPECTPERAGNHPDRRPMPAGYPPDYQVLLEGQIEG